MNTRSSSIKFISLFLLIGLSPMLQAQKVIPPENYGGIKEMKRIFAQELNYPPAAVEKSIGGRVLIDVSVDATGKVTQKKITEGVGREVDAEALRLVDLLLWDPALKDGKPIEEVAKVKLKFNPFKYETIVYDRGYKDPGYPKTATNIVWKEEELDLGPSIESKYESFIEYTRENLIFPEEAKTKLINGYVKVFFVIEPTGRVTNVKVLEQLEGNCDVVAMDLIQRSKWSPGVQGGIKVRTSRIEQIGFFSKNPNDNLFHSGEQTPNR